jgi:hypothetical protein
LADIRRAYSRNILEERKNKTGGRCIPVGALKWVCRIRTRAVLPFHLNPHFVG